LVSSLCWDAIGYPGYYDVHDLTSQYPGSYQTTFSNTHFDWEACWSTQYEHMFGLGYYCVAACDPSDNEESECAIIDYFYIDYRTSYLPENFNGTTNGDIKVDFDVSTGKFYYEGTQNLFPTYTSIWEQKAWIDSITTEFEPLPPENLSWYNFYDHPRIQWNHSANTGDYLTNYEIHRNLGQGWELIYTQSAVLVYFVDWGIDLGGSSEPEYLYYNVRAKNGDRTSDEFSNTVKVAGPSEFGKSSGENHTIVENNLINKLEQNFPNPFNPVTQISFSIKENSNVILTIFDILGNKLFTLIDEQLSAGNHKVKFDGSQLQSGIYFYEIRVNKFRDTKKLILVK